MNPKQESFVNAAPESCQGILRRAFDGTGSKRDAIKAHCLSCTHFDRAQIKACAVTLCPLHAYRPY